jgi:2-hydroxy-3-keto-5-methylthiopentenyl-1-phosphate phosphatase
VLCGYKEAAGHIPNSILTAAKDLVKAVKVPCRPLVIAAIHAFYGHSAVEGNLIPVMSEKPLRRYLFASDFDQTLTFNDSGYVLSELVGIPTEEFERKAKGMARLNLVQQGAELAYLLLHDPTFRCVRREHLFEVGKRIRLKENINLLYRILENGIDGYHFEFFVLSAAPVEVIQSALEGFVPRDHIFGTEFRYTSSGEIESITRATAGYGKVAVLDSLQTQRQIGPDHIIYTGDGSSDVHVMLHVNTRDGFTIAVSEAKHVSQVAKRTVVSTNALAIFAPILEEILGWERPRIREFFESHGLLIQEWDRVRTDWLTLRPAGEEQTDLADVAETASKVSE